MELQESTRYSMPELPDVEAILNYLKATSLHKNIEELRVADSRIVKGKHIKILKDNLTGRSFQSAKRRGKFVIVKTNSPYHLILHFGMTGDLRYFKNEEDIPKYTRMLLIFQNGYHLAYISQRMLGGIWLAKYPEELPTIASMGLEPLGPEFTLGIFQEMLRGRARVVKTLLMDQGFIAGVGNLYADEILFQARILPYRKARDLDEVEVVKLYKAIKEVLEQANKVSAQVWRLSHRFIIPHRHGDNRCPKCKKKLETMRIGSRTTFFCGKCQR